MSQSRRYFLKSTGLAMASFAAAPSFLVRTAMGQELSAGSGKDRPILIAVFQRGAADGVSMVAPFGDRSYASARPQIAVPAPRSGATDNAAIDLDGFFGFHPSLAPLKSIYDEGHLAVVHAVGSPDNTRSHFDAQDYMEAGAPGNKSVGDGWLNRYLQGAPRSGTTAFRAIALDANMPRSLMGPAPALAMARIQEFDVRGGPGDRRGGGNNELSAAFEAMWKNSTFDAIRMLRSANPQRFQPENGARYPGGLGQGLLQMAQLIKADIGLEVGFLDVGGWDTHANQPGQLNQRLREFGESLQAFYRDLGDRMRNVVVLTMTEFGRSIKQNGSGGTDHGHASALFVMGGPIKGRKVYGKWPGLAPEQLFEGRDLALTTDFRDVFSEVLTKHMQAADPTKVFPGWRPGQPLGIL